MVGVFWQITFFVPQFSLYNVEKIETSIFLTFPPLSLHTQLLSTKPVDRLPLQQELSVTWYCCHACQKIWAPTSSTVQAMWMYIAVDTELRVFTFQGIQIHKQMLVVSWVFI